jgi:peptidyl-tRNA hydrolase, PTH2 family
MKQVIVVNESLGLPRGKLAAQVAHAAVAAFLAAPEKVQSAWLAVGMPKVVVACDSEAELLELQVRALRAGLPAELVRDAGRTVLPPDTPTCLGIGPADEVSINPLTDSLRLVR